MKSQRPLTHPLAIILVLAAVVSSAWSADKPHWVREAEDHELRRLNHALQMVHAHLAADRVTSARDVAAHIARRAGTGDFYPSLDSYMLALSIADTAGDADARKVLAAHLARYVEAGIDPDTDVLPNRLRRAGAALREAGETAGAEALAQFAMARWFAADERADKAPPLTVAGLCQLRELAVSASHDGLKAACDQRLQALRHPAAPDGLSLAPHELAALGVYFKKQDDREAFDNVCRFIVDAYLAEPAIIGAIGIEDWVMLGDLIANHDDAALRQDLLDHLKGRLNAGRLLSPHAPPAALRSLLAMIGRLGGDDPTMTNQLIVQAMGLDPYWDQLDHAHVSAILTAVQGDMTALQDQDRALRASHASGGGSGGGGGEMTSADYAAMYGFYRFIGDTEKAREWSSMAFDRFIRNASGANSIDVTGTITALEVSTGRLDEQALADLVTAIVLLDETSAEVPDRLYSRLAGLIQASSDDGLATLQPHMRASTGEVNLAVVKVMAWMRRDAGTIRPFLVEITDLMRGAKADRLARFELARAYIVSLFDERMPVRTAGMPEMMSALAAAESDAMRLRCAGEIIAACATRRQYDRAANALESVLHQFDGELNNTLTAQVADLRAKQAAHDASREGLSDQVRAIRAVSRGFAQARRTDGMTQGRP